MGSVRDFPQHRQPVQEPQRQRGLRLDNKEGLWTPREDIDHMNVLFPMIQLHLMVN